jgi:hypothetical protein
MKSFTARGIIQDKIDRLVKQDKLRAEFAAILDAVEQQAIAAHELERLREKTGDRAPLDPYRKFAEDHAKRVGPTHDRRKCGGVHTRKRLGNKYTISCDAFDVWQARIVEAGDLNRFRAFRMQRGYQDGF